VTVSGGDPKNSGDNDLINAQMNQINKLLALKNQPDDQKSPPQNLMIDYTDAGRIEKLKRDPDFLNPNIPKKSYKYGLMHHFNDPEQEPEIEEVENIPNIPQSHEDPLVPDAPDIPHQALQKVINISCHLLKHRRMKSCHLLKYLLHRRKIKRR